jgi:hypothetical protein
LKQFQTKEIVRVPRTSYVFFSKLHPSGFSNVDSDQYFLKKA